MIDTWDQRLKEQADRGFKTPVVIEIDLATARTNKEYSIPGDLLYVSSVSSNSASAKVRLNRDTNEPIDLKFRTKIKTVFKSFYVSNTAQSKESIQILVGINFDIENLVEADEAHKVWYVSNPNPNTDTQGPVQVCNKAIIKADVRNTGIVWINYDYQAAQGSCHPLDPGEWVIVPISNLSKIHLNFEVGNEYAYLTPIL